MTKDSTISGASKLVKFNPNSDYPFEFYLNYSGTANCLLESTARELFKELGSLLACDQSIAEEKKMEIIMFKEQLEFARKKGFKDQLDEIRRILINEAEKGRTFYEHVCANNELATYMFKELEKEGIDVRFRNNFTLLCRW